MTHIPVTVINTKLRTLRFGEIPREIKTEDGEIVEQFLRAISMCSYCQRGFMASVCVVHSGRFKRHGKPHGMPDWEFFNLARDLGVMAADTNEFQFAEDEKQAALQHYAATLPTSSFVPATAMLYPWCCP